MSALAPEQRHRLVAAKLAALVGERIGRSAEVTGLPGGAATVADGVAWVLLDDQPERGLGTALAWAQRYDAARLEVVADTGTGVLARQATAFSLDIGVWSVQGAALVAATPDPPPTLAEPTADALAAAGVLTTLGAEVIVEHGIVRGEVRGLEVARVVEHDGVARVQPGVGRNDREGHALVGGALDAGTPLDTLRRVVVEVSRHRRGSAADRHPLGRMARGRWLRHRLTVDPAVVGAAWLAPVEPTVVRQSVTDDAAFAVGELLDGAPVVVGCAAGIDLGLVPGAADVRLVEAARTGVTPQLALVGANRALHPVIDRMAAALTDPATIVALPDDWYVGAPAD